MCMEFARGAVSTRHQQPQHPLPLSQWQQEGNGLLGKFLMFILNFDGDYQYLGRILAMLDPCKDSFAALPPHWKDPTHPAVLKGLDICFGGVIRAHTDATNPEGFLSLCMASIVHHSEWLLGKCSEHTNHPFHQLPLIHNHILLAELKENHLTTEPNDHVPIATDIPPHITHSKSKEPNFAKPAHTFPSH